MSRLLLDNPLGSLGYHFISIVDKKVFDNSGGVYSSLRKTWKIFVAFQIPVFTNRAQRHLVSHPKFYLFDAGVFRALRAVDRKDKDEEIDGTALEGLVLQHLRAWSDYSKGKYEIYYWRTKSGLEVDFVVFGEGDLWAIEVKNNRKVNSSDVRSLLHFKADYPECKTLLLYRGTESIVENGVLCMPCDAFLRQLIPNNPLF